jgi:hypothetical protein
MSNRALFRGVRGPRNEVDLSPPSKAVVRNEWSYTFVTPVVFMTMAHVSFWLMPMTLIYWEEVYIL